MPSYVIKRSGDKVDFDRIKICDAIFSAGKTTGIDDYKTAVELADLVESKLNKIGKQTFKIEAIQDVIEETLKEMGLFLVADSFVSYRNRRKAMRETLKISNQIETNSDSTDKHLLITANALEYSGWDKSKIIDTLKQETKMKDHEIRMISKLVEKKILSMEITQISAVLVRELINNELVNNGFKKLSDRKNNITISIKDIESYIGTKSNENSNISTNNPEAVNLAIAETVLKKYALQKIFSPDIAKAHNNGRIHLHDLGYPTRVYCSSHSLEYLKKYGLKLNNLDSISAPAKHARTLTGHLNTFLASMQAFYAGALGIGYINIMYAPLVDGLSYDEMVQEAQHLIFSSSQNAFSRGGQTLFLDFNIHTGVPKYMKNIKAIGPGGKYLNKTYGEYEDVARMFTKALLQVWSDGDTNGNLFAFPKCLDKSTQLLIADDSDKNNVVYSYITIENLANLKSFDNVLLPKYDKQSKSRIWVNIKDIKYRGNEIGIAIRYSNGGVIKSTKDHKHYISDKNGGYKIVEANDIKINDYLISYNEISQSLVNTKIKDIYEVPVETFAIEVDHEDHDFITADGILTKNCDFHVNEDTFKDPKQKELFDFACEISAKNGVPYFIFDRDEVTLSACCRLRTVIEDNYMIDHPESMRFSFPRNEMVIIRRRDEILSMSFGELFESINSEIVNIDGFEVKDVISRDYEVWDKTGFIQLLKVSRHKKTSQDSKNLVAIKTKDGRIVTVTSNHPIVCNDITNVKEAKTLKKSDFLLNANDAFTQHYVPTKKINTELGYYVGDFFGFSSKNCGNTSYCNQLNSDYLYWDEDTFGSVLCGIIDNNSISDSTIKIKSTSKILLSQIQMWFRIKYDIYCIMDIIDEVDSNGHRYFVLEIPVDLNIKNIFSKLRVNKIETAIECDDNYLRNSNIDDIITYQDDAEDYVYDITTETGTFVSNGLILHNCGFQNVTINLPQCAYRSGSNNIDGFLKEMEDILELAINAHLQKKSFISNLMSSPTMPLWQIGKPAEDGMPYVDLEKATYIVGIIGLNEAVQHLIGKELHEGDEPMILGLRIISHLYYCIKEFGKKYNIKITIEESPAESAARRLAKIDLKNWPELAKRYIRGSIKDDEVYYTNSIHLRPDVDIPLIDRIEKQAKFHSLIESGAIIHAFIGEQKPSAKAIGSLVEKVFYNTNAAQFTVSPTYTICEKCHKNVAGFKNVCPHCGATNIVDIERLNDTLSHQMIPFTIENLERFQ